MLRIGSRIKRLIKGSMDLGRHPSHQRLFHMFILNLQEYSIIWVYQCAVADGNQDSPAKMTFSTWHIPLGNHELAFILCEGLLSHAIPGVEEVLRSEILNVHCTHYTIQCYIYHIWSIIMCAITCKHHFNFVQWNYLWVVWAITISRSIIDHKMKILT